mgnify:CR=1 FL=1
MLGNIYITILLIVSLMFLDYFLTIKSVKLAKQGYSKYIKVESYELNPLFKENVDKMKYSLRHFLFVIFAAVIIYFFHYLSKSNLILNMNAYFTFQGMLFSLFVFINASHIRNLIVFKTIKKDNSLLSGRLRQKHPLSIKMSSADALKVFIILMALFMFSPSYFNFGFALGPLLLVWKHRAWTKKYLKEKKKN